MPFPYSEDARSAVRQSVTHVVRIEAAGRTLDVRTANLAFDEGRLPFVELDATCALPDDVSFLDALDPRKGAQVKIWAGYRYQSGTVEAPLVGDLILTQRDVSRPENTLRIQATSREIRLDRHGVTESWSPEADAQRDTYAVLAQIVRLAYPTAPVRNLIVRDRYTPPEPLVVQPGASLLQTAVALADAAPDAWFYEDGLGVWNVRDRAKIGTAEAILAVGENGTILSGSTSLSADDFANAVLVEHRWRDGATERVVRGYAAETTGPLGTIAAGRTLKVVTRNSPTGLDRANLSAQVILSRTLSRGKGFDFEAVSHLWLRPGDTVTVQMPDSPQERHLIAAVRFDLRTGRMRVATRQPADREIYEEQN